MDLGLISGLFGGIFTGLVGPWIKNHYAAKQQAAQYAHEENMIKAESDAMIAEVNANIERDRIQTEGRIDEKVIGAMSEAVKSADKTLFKEEYLKYLAELPPLFGTRSYIGPPLAAMVVFGIACVDLWRQSVRPGLTTYLAVFSSVVTYMAYRIVRNIEGGIDADFAQEVFKMCVYLILYLTVSAFGFWFCDRAKGVKGKIAGKI